MAARPKPNLAALVVPKATAAAAVPHVQPAAQAPAKPAQKAAPGATVSLTIKLDVALYARLLRRCALEGAATGRRLTHQEFGRRAIEQALNADDPDTAQR